MERAGQGSLRAGNTTHTGTHFQAREKKPTDSDRARRDCSDPHYNTEETSGPAQEITCLQRQKWDNEWFQPLGGSQLLYTVVVASPILASFPLLKQNTRHLQFIGRRVLFGVMVSEVSVCGWLAGSKAGTSWQTGMAEESCPPHGIQGNSTRQDGARISTRSSPCEGRTFTTCPDAPRSKLY